MDRSPHTTAQVKAPPIKCQGIKTRLVPFLRECIHWNDTPTSRWIEPFLGSGAVVLNFAPERAVLSDTNPHIIRLYRALQSGDVTADRVRAHLESEGARLAATGTAHYYSVRERFNAEASPLDFLFLSRSCFNGVMRFNGKGEFNVPFCRKPGRFQPAYVTRICNQVAWAAGQMRGKEWEFRAVSWDKVLAEARADDFVYLDPPYIGRHAGYYNDWTEEEAARLAQAAHRLPCGFAASMWLRNRYRSNTHITAHWPDVEMRTYRHFYYVGSREELRNAMEEALLIKRGFAGKSVGTGEPPA